MNEKKRIKLVIATGIYPPDIGGPASYSKLVAEKLSSVCKVVVVTYSDILKSNNEDYKVVRVLRNENKIKRYIHYFLAVLSEIKGARKEKVIVYAQDPVSSGIPAFFASLFGRVEFYIKIVGDYAWEQGVQRCGIKDSLDEFQNKRYSFFVEFLKFAERFIAKKAKLVIVPSVYLKNIVLSWGVKEKNIEVIYNSYNSKRVDYKNDKKDDEIALISVGRLVPWKGFYELIEVFAELLDKFPNLKLKIVGDGPDRQRLEKLVAKLGLKNKVLFLGVLDKDSLFLEFQKSKIFVLNSSYEGFSHLILEAMDAQVPVLTTKVGGNVELIDDGVNGILIDIGNRSLLRKKLEELLQNQKLLDTLSKNAKESIKKFNEDKMIQKLTKALKV